MQAGPSGRMGCHDWGTSDRGAGGGGVGAGVRRRRAGPHARGLAVGLEEPARGGVHADAWGRLVRAVHGGTHAGGRGRRDRPGRSWGSDRSDPGPRRQRPGLLGVCRPGRLGPDPGGDAGAAVPRGPRGGRGLAQRRRAGRRVLARQVPSHRRRPHGGRAQQRHPRALPGGPALDRDPGVVALAVPPRRRPGAAGTPRPPGDPRIPHSGWPSGPQVPRPGTSQPDPPPPRSATSCVHPCSGPPWWASCSDPFPWWAPGRRASG